jgi:hypothetical protein
LFYCFYCIYRDIIEYRDNFLDNNREMIFLISPNPIDEWLNCCYIVHILSFSLASFISRTTKNYICSVALIFFVRHKMSCDGHQSGGPLEIYFQAWFGLTQTQTKWVLRRARNIFIPTNKRFRECFLCKKADLFDIFVGTLVGKWDL